MKYRDTYPTPILRQGYYDLGPPLSRHIQVPWGLTDRQDGTVWFITASTNPGDIPFTTPGVPRLAWNTTPPGHGITTPTIFPAFSEPVLSGSQLRIFVRSGRLGFEETTTHIYGGPRWVAQHVTNWRSVKYELVVPAGGLPTPARLAFDTDIEDF